METYYIPNGPKNLAVLFPTLDFSKMVKYYVKAKLADNTVIASLPYNLTGVHCCCCGENIRVRYINYCGTVDGMDFKLITQEHEAKSDSFEKPVGYPLIKTEHNVGRFNIKANEIITLSNSDYGEQDRKWVNELIDSPMHWIEVNGIEGQPDSYIPMVIEDTKIVNIKQEDRFINEIIIQIRPSHEKYVIRN